MEDDASPSVGETSHYSTLDQSQFSALNASSLGTDTERMADAVQPDFQDSNMSPALHLLPAASGAEHNLTEFSLFQQSDTEFAPLRAFPDNSMVSENLPSPTLNLTDHPSESDSLSQHPLAEATVLSEEAADIPLSQQEHQSHADILPPDDDKQQILSEERKREADAALREKIIRKDAEDKTFFLKEDVPAEDLLKVLQIEVGMQSSSESFPSESSATNPPPDIKVSYEPSEVTEENVHMNITVGSRSTLPDESSERLHKELLIEANRLQNKSESKSTPNVQLLTQTPEDQAKGNQREVEAFSATVEAPRKNFWLENQTGMDGSYTSLLPQSQSTPGVFKVPLKSSVKLGRLSAIASDKESSYSLPGGVPRKNSSHTSTEVQSLPSLNYMEKVEAWRTNQDSENQLFDRLAPQESSNVGPENEVLDAASESLNSTLTQQGNDFHQLPVSAASSDVPQSFPTTSSESLSLRRCYAMGSAPSDRDGGILVVQPPALPIKSNSLSSSSMDTVTMPGQKHQQPDKQDETEENKVQETTYPLESRDPPLTSRAQLSDVSLERDVMRLSSQDSYSKAKTGATSAVGGEPDNSASYWTQKPSAPSPLHSISNIDEQIPFQLQNLGKDQVSTSILHSSAPRQSDFSPTDLPANKVSDEIPFNGGSRQKVKILGSSQSSVSVPFSLESLPPAVSASKLLPPTDTPSREFAASHSGEADHSLLLSEKLGDRSVSQKKSTQQPDPLTTVTLLTVTSSTVVSKSSRRAEPEGCSAAPPDGVPKKPLAVRGPQLSLTAEEQQQHPSSDSSLSLSEMGQERASDGSSESSLSARVAKLLQKESPDTVTSSSSTKSEESKTTEWMKLSGKQSEHLELDAEDRKQVEEIKKELLLRNPLQSSSSGSTDSSTASSIRRNHQVHVSAGTYSSRREDVSSRQTQESPPLDQDALLYDRLRPSSTPIKQTVTSSSFSTPVRPLSLPYEPLRLTELATHTAEHTHRADRISFTHKDVKELPLVYEPGKSFQTETLHPETTNQRRRDTVGGRFEGHLPSSYDPHKDQKTPRDDGSSSFRHSGSFASLKPDPPADLSLSSGRLSHHLPPAYPAHVEPSPPASSLDEGVGSSSPPEWHDIRETERQKVLEKVDFSSLLKSTLPQEEMSSNRVTQLHKPASQHRYLVSEPPAPVLLPYKPRGCEELFYVPRREADLSSAEQSDTTMESSHTGSNDAVPPEFSSDVLGHLDPGLDRGVTFKHTEGIYSKRLRTTGFNMHDPGNTADVQVLPSFTTESPIISTRDQGTSPLPFSHYKQSEPSLNSSHVVQTPQVAWERDQQETKNLDQRWQRFCEQRCSKEPHSSSTRDATLLERLERLSRLIHAKRPAGASHVQEEVHHPEAMRRETHREAKRRERGEERQEKKKSKSGRREATTQTRSVGSVEEEKREPFSVSSHPSPRDKWEDLSTTSGSISTVDTPRLARIFGAQKVQHLKSNRSLGKLHCAINKQREEKERWRGRKESHLHFIPPSHTPASDQSVASDSSSAASTSTLKSEQSSSTSGTIQLVSRNAQTGLRNGTPRRTRDVGTTVPSPSDAHASSMWRERRAGQKNLSRSHSFSKHRKKIIPAEIYPPGVSWFISADQESEARKENKSEDSRRPTTVWFESTGSADRDRIPLRQRQAHHDGNHLHGDKHHADGDPPAQKTSDALVRISLQEALQMQRPGFISRSEQRMKQLALQAEERKLQAMLDRTTGIFSYQPGRFRQRKPAGCAPTRRAVPRKEMIQRSKKIYNNLPEIRRRKDDEKRRAEYQSYRLNAQLYKKWVTDQILGRRSAFP